MLAVNAAGVYGFDLDALAPIAARVGPKVADVAHPLETLPKGSTRCPAFAEGQAMGLPSE